MSTTPTTGYGKMVRIFKSYPKSQCNVTKSLSSRTQGYAVNDKVGIILLLSGVRHKVLRTGGLPCHPSDYSWPLILHTYTPPSPEFIRAENRFVGPILGESLYVCFKNISKNHNKRQSQSKFGRKRSPIFFHSIITEDSHNYLKYFSCQLV